MCERNVEADRRSADNLASTLETRRFQLRETVHRLCALRVSSETHSRNTVALQQHVSIIEEDSHFRWIGAPRCGPVTNGRTLT